MTKLTAVTENGTTKFINLPVCPTTGKVRITRQQLKSLFHGSHSRNGELTQRVFVPSK